MTLRLLLVFAVCAACAPTSLSPLVLPVMHNQFVQLITGNPGQRFLYQLDFSHSDIHLYTNLESVSQTFSLSSNGQNGTEIFYIGKYRIRMPFVYMPYPQTDIDLPPTGSFQGTLGLGEFSPLWLYWDNISVSQKSIIFGQYYVYAQYDYTERPPPIGPNFMGTVRSEDNTTLEMCIEFDRVETALPPFYYHNDLETVYLVSYADCNSALRKLIHDPIAVCSDDVAMDVGQQTIRLRNKMSYRSIVEAEDEMIHIGRRWMQNNAWFYDNRYNSAIVARSAFHFSQPGGLVICGLVLSLLVITWGMLVLAYKFADEWIFNLVLLLELYSHLLSWAIFAITTFGLQWTRLVVSFVHGDPSLLFTFIVYFITAGSTFSFVAIVRNVRPALPLKETPNRHSDNVARMQRFRNPRIVFVLGSMMAALWLCFVEFHFSTFDLFYLLLISIILTVVSTVLTLGSIYHRHPLAYLQVLQTITYYIFLYAFNFVPIFRIMNLEKSSFFIGIYALILVFWLALVIFTKHDIISIQSHGKWRVD